MKVLLTDDSMTIRIIIRDLMQELGHTDVSEGRNGREAWEMLQKEQFDLILLDIHMPEMDGLTVLEKIKTDPDSSHQHVPVVFITSDTDYRQIEKAKDLKAFGYIKKPFKREGLEAAINAARRAEERRLSKAAEEAESSSSQADIEQAVVPPAAEETVSPPPPAQPSVAAATQPATAAAQPAANPGRKRGIVGWMRSIFGS